MKKSIFAFIVSFVLLICMAACSEVNPPESTSNGGGVNSISSDTVTESIYDKLDGFADLNYLQIYLTIVTVTGDIQLSANYTLTQSNVRYSVEQLNMLPSNGELTGVSPEYKTTYTGYAKIVDGKVTELDGEEVILPSYDELKGNFSFEESNFNNVVMHDNAFSADVVLPSSFYGSAVNVQDMNVAIEYTETAFSKMTITYKTYYSTVTTVYEFIG